MAAALAGEKSSVRRSVRGLVGRREPLHQFGVSRARVVLLGQLDGDDVLVARPQDVRLATERIALHLDMGVGLDRHRDDGAVLRDANAPITSRRRLPG